MTVHASQSAHKEIVLQAHVVAQLVAGRAMKSGHRKTIIARAPWIESVLFAL